MGSVFRGCLACLWVLASTVVSAQVSNPFAEEPKVSYYGVREMVTSEGTIKMKEYHAPKMQRVEMEGPTGPVVMINRRDKGVAWMLMPAMNIYMEVPATQFEQQTGGGVKVVEHSKVGTETLDGHKVDKYKSLFEDDMGNKGGGYYWVTKDGIPLQMDMVYKDGENKRRIKMKLTELEVGPQAPTLFEIPPGFTGMPSMGGMGMGSQTAPTGSDNPPQGGQQPTDIKSLLKQIY